MLELPYILIYQIIKQYPDHKCKTSDPPKNDKTMHDSNKCKQYWEEAVKLDPSKIKTAHRIEVDGKYCYNPSIYSKKGWCELADDPSKWGVCSPMCDPDFMKVHIATIVTKKTAHFIIYNLHCSITRRN